MKSKYSIEVLRPVIRSSQSWAECCRKIGTKPSTGSQSYLKSVAVKLGISSAHFLGQGYSKGKKYPNRQVPLDRYLRKNGLPISSHSLKNRLIDKGLKRAKCEECGRVKWRGEPLVLELDHVNGDHFDNRLENLMVLCPNCHALKTRKSSRCGEIGETQQT